MPQLLRIVTLLAVSPEKLNHNFRRRDPPPNFLLFPPAELSGGSSVQPRQRQPTHCFKIKPIKDPLHRRSITETIKH